MGSVFATEETLHTTADLKGSLAGRMAKPGERVIKDQDVVRLGIKLKLGAERKAIFMDQARTLPCPPSRALDCPSPPVRFAGRLIGVCCA